MLNYRPFMLFWSSLFLLLSLEGKAQITLIPNAAFEAKLIQLGLDTDGLVNGQVATSDISSVTNLYINNAGIQDITGIQDFTSLLLLDCSYNPITSIDLSGNTALQTLNCGSTNVVRLDLQPCVALERLITNNVASLVDIDLSNSSSLLNLTVGYTGLSQLDLSNTPLLRTLNIDKTNLDLDSLQLGSLTRLKNLNVDLLGLDSIDLAIIPNLETFSCRGNNLTALDVSQNPKLRSLICGHNRLTTLDVWNNPKLSFFQANDNRLTTLDVSRNPLLSYFAVQNNTLSYVNAKALKLYQFSSRVRLESNAPNLQVCVIDAIHVNNYLTNWRSDPTVTYTENCNNTSLVGHLREDANNNCLAEPNEIGLRKNMLMVAGLTDTFYTATTDLGFYAAELLPGNYDVFLRNEMPYRVHCLTNQMVTIDSIGDLDTLNWSSTTQVDCPYLQVNMSAPFLRATGGGSAYTISYCNQGTADAYNSYVEVTLDTLLQVVGTSLPIQSQVGNVYTFDLDTIPESTCGSFQIQVVVDSTVMLGVVHCNEVHIYPDTLCVNNWSGPIIESKSNCIPDSVHFRLYNTGSTMLTAQTYSIFEDHVMLFTGPFTLGANDSLEVTYPSQPGKVYRIEAVQAPGIPPYVASPIAHSTTFSCQPDAITGQWNSAALLQFYQDNSTPWVDVDCQPSISSYDPNDKAAQPVGYGAAHYITRGTSLSYKVRFQNTGNDTAFTVVVVDTLSSFLDATTLNITGSSHPYTWTLSGAGILRMTFNGIKLVDSLTNEPLSHGFFTYEIAQKPSVALGSLIENTAAIYFDYNLPIFTNTTFHTIGENFQQRALISVDKVWSEETTVLVYPNPFNDQTTIEVKGGSTFEELDIEVVDVAGRIVEQVHVQHKNYILLSRKQLVQGLYFYRLLEDGQLIGTGKLQVR